MAETSELQTQRLILREPCADDLPTWNAFFLSDRGNFIGGGAEHDAGRAWRAFATIVGHWSLNGCGPFVLVDKASGQPVGSAGPWFPVGWPERELSWSVWRPDAEGKGFAREAIEEIRRHVYRDLGWDTAVSYIDPANTRSVALAKRLGCVIDPEAAVPRLDAVLVHRHPGPE